MTSLSLALRSRVFVFIWGLTFSRARLCLLRLLRSALPTLKGVGIPVQRRAAAPQHSYSLHFQSEEMLLGRGCPARNYISQPPVHICDHVICFHQWEWE